jgi:hypothetical protein
MWKKADALLNDCLCRQTAISTLHLDSDSGFTSVRAAYVESEYGLNACNRESSAYSLCAFETLCENWETRMTGCLVRIQIKVNIVSVMYFVCNTNECTVRIYINFFAFVLCRHVSVIHIGHNHGVHCNIKSTIESMCVVITCKFWCQERKCLWGKRLKFYNILQHQNLDVITTHLFWIVLLILQCVPWWWPIWMTKTCRHKKKQ